MQLSLTDSINKPVLDAIKLVNQYISSPIELQSAELKETTVNGTYIDVELRTKNHVVTMHLGYLPKFSVNKFASIIMNKLSTENVPMKKFVSPTYAT